MKFNGRPLSNMDAVREEIGKIAGVLRLDSRNGRCATQVSVGAQHGHRCDDIMGFGRKVRESPERPSASPWVARRCRIRTVTALDPRRHLIDQRLPRRNGSPPVKRWAVPASSGVTTSPSRSCITLTVVAGRSDGRTNTSAAGSRHSRSTGREVHPLGGKRADGDVDFGHVERRETNRNHATGLRIRPTGRHCRWPARPDLNRSINVLSAWQTAAASPVPLGTWQPHPDTAGDVHTKAAARSQQSPGERVRDLHFVLAATGHATRSIRRHSPCVWKAFSRALFRGLAILDADHSAGSPSILAERIVYRREHRITVV